MQQQTISFNHHLWQVKIRDDADCSVIAEIFKLREYRAAEEAIKQAIDPIIDVGAHAGFFTLYARALNSNAKIIAIEPEPKNIQFLWDHLSRNNLKNVSIVEGALSSKTGKHKLVVSEDTHNHRLSDGSIDVETISVPAHTLAGILKKFKIHHTSLLKMDVEGAEYEIFGSLLSDDFEKIGAIIMEYHNDHDRNYRQLEQILRERGFGVQLFPSKFDRSMGFIFAKNKRK